MTTVKEAKKPERKKNIWTKEEKEKIKSQYGCDIVIEDGSLGDVRTKKAPTDSYIIQYEYDSKVHFDLTRGTKVNLFDMYWDKFKNGLKTIDYGSGTIKPYLWGYQSPKQSKKKRKV
tara:strand:- start:135 stop:485 length:351 start_codon:yes stop_codon:yes gene_type:complete